MSIFVQRLAAEFNESDLDFIKTEVLNFHYSHKQVLAANYNPGKLKHVPNIGYYIPLFESTHKDRAVKSWTEINDTTVEDINLSVIKMKVNEEHYQNIYVVKPHNYFSNEFYNVLHRVLKNVPVEFQLQSTSVSVQEFGYSMKFHIDAGIESRIHITLNKDSIDMFYTADGSFRMKYGECYLFQANKTTHGFMAFQTEPRVHLIMDIV